MLMLRLIVPAIILKISRKKKLLFRFFCSFFLASLTFGYLWNSSSTAYATNDNKEKQNTVHVGRETKNHFQTVQTKTLFLSTASH